MKIQTFSVVAGSAACNARCPFCISKMTVDNTINLKEPKVNWRNFSIACKIAKQNNVTTVMITGKGEPTLFPEQITKYLEQIKKFDFPLVEIQSNGIPPAENPEKYSSYLKNWYDLGLTHYAISVVHHEEEKNREVYLPHKTSYIDLVKLINYLHEHKLSVRLTCIMADGFIDSAGKLRKLISFAKENEVEQLTVSRVNRPQKDQNHNQTAYDWVGTHFLKDDQIKSIEIFMGLNGNKLMTLPHGAMIYDVSGQNVCLSYCLTINPDSDEIRQLIFFPDGHIRYDWQYQGAIIL